MRSDPTRAKIIFDLSRAELCLCDVAALLRLSVSAALHQLVTYRKTGRLAYYSLDDDYTAQLLQAVLSHVLGDFL